METLLLVVVVALFGVLIGIGIGVDIERRG